MKKIAFLLAVCMLACCLPVAAFAADLPVTDETVEVVSEKKTPRRARDARRCPQGD